MDYGMVIIKTADSKALFGYRPKSINVGLGCGLGWTRRTYGVRRYV